MAQQTALSVMGIPGMVHSFSAKASLVPTQPGLEFTMPENRMHFDFPENLSQFTMPANRMHFDIPEED